MFVRRDRCSFCRIRINIWSVQRKSRMWNVNSGTIVASPETLTFQCREVRLESNFVYFVGIDFFNLLLDWPFIKMLYLFESQWYLITFTSKVLEKNTSHQVFHTVCFFQIHWISSTRTSTTHLESKKRKLQKVIGQSFSQPCSIWSSLQTAQGFLINMHGGSAPPRTTKENKPLIYLATTGLKVTYFSPK